MNKSNKNSQKITNMSQKIKKKVIKNTEKELKDTYKNISILIQNELKNETENSFSENDLKRLQKKINNELKEKSKEIKMIIQSATTKMIESAVENNLKYFKEIDKKHGSNLYNIYKEKYKDVKSNVIKSVINGEMYKDKHSLSNRIWKDLNKNKNSIEFIIQQGIKNKDHPLDIAKKLDKYVNPNKAKDFNWSKVYPGSKNKIEYNSLRLARTSINHAHHQSIIEMAKKNPLVTKVEWLSAGAHGRTCEMCSNRDGKVYELSKVPQDHPNGMCDLLEVMPDDDTMERLMDEFMESSYDDFDDFTNDYNL